MTCTHHVSLGSSPLFLMTRTVLKSSAQVPCRTPSTGVCVLFFWGRERGAEVTTEVKGPSPHPVSRARAVNMACHGDVDLERLAAVSFVPLAPCSYSFFSPLSCTLGRKSLPSPRLRSRLEGADLHGWLGILCVGEILPFIIAVIIIILSIFTYSFITIYSVI